MVTSLKDDVGSDACDVKGIKIALSRLSTIFQESVVNKWLDSREIAGDQRHEDSGKQAQTIGAVTHFHFISNLRCFVRVQFSMQYLSEHSTSGIVS